MDLDALLHGLAWPLARLLFFVSLGLFIANLIEALNWTRAVARVAAPLTRLAHLKDIAGAAFSMAFFSPVSANAMLAEHYERGELTDRELILANLFDALPSYFIHLPTMFFITLPFLGATAAVYVGLTFSSALLRTLAVVLGGRLFLPPLPEGCVTCILDEQKAASFREALGKSWQRFQQRIRRILMFTLPIYVLFYFGRQAGVFEAIETFLAERVSLLAYLDPQALTIVVFHVGAEFTAGVAAAGALIGSGGLEPREVVLALLTGNVLSSPMRAVRHQFPYYAGIFTPRMAMKLILVNQSLRALSVFAVGVIYYLATR